MPWLSPDTTNIPGTTPDAGQVLDACTVDSVYDGDTMTVRCAGQEVKVRLYCIDAPEMGQKPWGRRSRGHLRSITPNTVRIRVRDTDRYGRTVGEVLAGERNLNLGWCGPGGAVEYERYCEVPG
ncbi:MAG: thermonuclease family protein [Arhodomonas sp.]|nr:thermonuclease family protein [Arhodomonas sp.]